MSHRRIVAGFLALSLSALAWLPAGPSAGARAAGAIVPITLVRNKVLVPVRVNGSRPLSLILDSGMGFEGVLLFRPALKDSIGPARLNQARIPGAGGGPPSEAVFADSLDLQVGDVRIGGQRVIVLSDSAMALGRADGVIGWTLLGRYAVEIDYGRLAITLHDPGEFRPREGWASLPLAMDARHLPFLEVSAAVGPEAPTRLKVYIDCASSETLELLTRDGMKLRLPERTTEVVLGRGLSGEIRGRRGTIARLVIGPHELRDVEAAFVPAAIRSKAGDGDAVLANGALCRFDVVFDYAHSQLHVRPNRHVPEPLDRPSRP